jgi:hypothetical protein
MSTTCKRDRPYVDIGVYKFCIHENSACFAPRVRAFKVPRKRQPLPGWLVKSQLVIHSPESKIEYFVLSRVENSKIASVANEDSPEEPSRQHSIAR